MDAFKNLVSDPNLSAQDLWLTNAFDAVHDNVQFLSWSELSYQDVPVHWSDPVVCKHVCLIPYGNPVYVPGIHCQTQQGKAERTSENTAWKRGLEHQSRQDSAAGGPSSTMTLGCTATAADIPLLLFKSQRTLFRIDLLRRRMRAGSNVCHLKTNCHTEVSCWVAT